jgi:hypothetical protein
VTRFRAGLAVAVASLTLAVGADAALACVFPNISTGTTSAGPGDPVDYTASNVRAGAEIEIYAGGRVVVPRHVVGESEISGTGVRGSFPMPDLGSTSTTVKLALWIDHADMEETPLTRYSEGIHYAAASSGASEQAPEAQEPATHPAPSAGPPARAPAARPAPRARTRGTPAPQSRIPGGHAGPGHPLRNRSAGRPTAAVRAGSGRTLAAPLAGRGLLPSSHARVGNVRHAARPVNAAVAPKRVLDGVLGGPAARRTRPTGGGGSKPLLVLLALVVAGPAAAFLLRFRRSGGAPAAVPAPVPPGGSANGLALEAELQELIAEEKAREELERARGQPVG